MSVVENKVLKRLREGDLALGFGIRQARTADLGMIARACGYDWVMLDLEHNTMNIDEACQLCVAALETGVAPLVRVPSHHHHHVARVLDGGAMGVIVPHVDTAEQAREVVRNCKYPPVGNRSLAGLMPQLRFQPYPTAEALNLLNDNMVVVVMLETPEAIENADEIAAVDGVDVLLIGSNDLSAQMGIPGQFSHERIGAAYRAVVTAANRHGKFPGMGGCYDHGLMQRYIETGARFILSGGDLAFLMAGARERSTFLRGLALEKVVA